MIAPDEHPLCSGYPIKACIQQTPQKARKTISYLTTSKNQLFRNRTQEIDVRFARKRLPDASSTTHQRLSALFTPFSATKITLIQSQNPFNLFPLTPCAENVRIRSRKNCKYDVLVHSRTPTSIRTVAVLILRPAEQFCNLWRMVDACSADVNGVDLITICGVDVQIRFS